MRRTTSSSSASVLRSDLLEGIKSARCPGDLGPQGVCSSRRPSRIKRPTCAEPAFMSARAEST